MDPVSFEDHDHARCIQSSIAAADEHCKANGLNFTPVRRRVLEFLLQEHRALGAYDILDKLRAENMSAQPPVAYRALDFLVQNGFAHKIERLNAFIACAHMGHDHNPAFLICRGCDAVAETHADPSRGRLAQAAQNSGFTIEQSVVEALGLCPACQDAP